MKKLKVHVPIYNRSVILCCPRSEKDYNSVELEDYQTFKACTGAIVNVCDDGTIVLALNEESLGIDKAMLLGLLAHEVQHVANNILFAAGVDACHENDEAQAYLVGYLFTALYTKLCLLIKE